MPEIKCFELGALQANCYFVTDGDEAFVVDPGDKSSKLTDCINDFGAEKLRYIILTHGHFDHIGFAAGLKKLYQGASVVIGAADSEFAKNDTLNLSLFFGTPAEHFDPDIIVSDGDTLPFAGGEITVLSTPGHTRGSICLRYGSSLFSGDTIMRCTTGRTDFPTGNGKEMLSSARKLAAIDENLTIYCGHGMQTTLDFERTHNFAMGNNAYDDMY